MGISERNVVHENFKEDKTPFQTDDLALENYIPAVPITYHVSGSINQPIHSDQ